MKSINIFISYRRNDSAGHARALYEELKKEFNVFFDIEGIEYGDTFPESIQKGIKKAHIVLIVIGDDSEEEFKSRMEKGSKDYVALEIAYAKELNKDIIPVLVGNAYMPSKNAIPKTIEFLPELNAYTVRHDKFSTDIIGLKERIREKHFQIYNWYIFLVLAIVFGTLFSFEKPREYLVDFVEESYSRVINSPKEQYVFSLTDNLSAYSLMPNPTYDEWKIFLKDKENNQTKEDYRKFIEIKNKIEKTNLIDRPLLDDESIKYDNLAKYKYHKCNIKLDVSYLSKLLDIDKRNPNSLVDYYIGILGIHLGGDKEQRFTDSLQSLRLKGYRKYANKLELIKEIVKNKDLGILEKNNDLLSPCYYLDFNITNKIDANSLENSSYSSCSYDLVLKNSTISNENKFESLENFLNKNNYRKEQNGQILLNAYINLFNKENKKAFFRLIKKYPTDISNQLYLLSLLSLNQEVSIDELESLLIAKKTFFNDIGETKIEKKFLAVKKENDISLVLDIFKRNKDIFVDLLNTLEQKNTFQEDKQCFKNKNLNNIFFTHFINEYIYEDTSSYPLLLKNMDIFYQMHGVNIKDSCWNDVEWNNYFQEENNKEYFFSTFFYDNNVSLEKKGLDKFVFEVLALMKDMRSENNESNISKKLSIFLFNNSEEALDFLGNFSDYKVMLMDTLITSLNKTFSKYKYDFVTKNYDANAIVKYLIKDLDRRILALEDIDKTSCSILYFFDKYNYLLKKDYSFLENFSNNIFEKKCLKYKDEIILQENLIIFSVQNTILGKNSEFIKDLNLSTSIETLEYMKLPYYIDLIQLISPSFYKKYTADELKEIIIPDYLKRYDEDLVSALIFFYLISEKKDSLSNKKNNILSDFININTGEYHYFIAISKRVLDELNTLLKVGSLFNVDPQLTGSIKLESSYSFKYNIYGVKIIITSNPQFALAKRQLEYESNIVKRINFIQEKIDFFAKSEFEYKEYYVADFIFELGKTYLDHDKDELANKNIEIAQKAFLTLLSKESNNDSKELLYTKILSTSTLLNQWLFDIESEREYFSRFKNNKERLMTYEFYKLLAIIGSKQEINNKFLEDKYKDTNINIDSEVLYAWIKNKKDFFLQNKLQEFVDIYTYQGKLDVRRKEYEQEISKFNKQKKSNLNPLLERTMFVRHVNIANLYMYENKIDDAIVEYNKGLKTIETLILENNNTNYQIDLAVVHDRLGDIYKIQRKSNKASIEYTKSLKVIQSLNYIDSNNSLWKEYLVNSYKKLKFLPDSYLDKINEDNNLSSVENRYKKALKEYKVLNTKELNIYNVDIGNIFYSLGIFYKKQKQFKKAVQSFTQGLELYQKEEKKNSKKYVGEIAMIFNQLGAVYLIELKEYNNALEAYKKSLFYFQKLDNKNSQKAESIATTYNALAESYKGLKQYDKVVIEYKNKVKLYEKEQKEYPKKYIEEIATICNQLGTVYLVELKEYNNALEAYKKSLFYVQKLDNKNSQKVKSIATTYNAFAESYKGLKQYDNALEAYKKSLFYFQKLDNSHSGKVKSIAMTYNALAESYKGLKQYDNALEAYKKSLFYFQKLDNSHSGKVKFIATTYNALAESYKELKQYDKAILEYENKVKLYEEEQKKYPRKYVEEIAHLYNDNLGNIYRNKLKQYEKASEAYKNALFFYKNINEKNSEKVKWMGTTYSNLAETYEKLKLYDKAIIEYENIIKLYEEEQKKYPKKYLEKIATIYNKIGGIYLINLEEYNKAIDKYKKSLVLFQSLDDNQKSRVRSIAITYHALAQSYFELGEYDNAILQYENQLRLYQEEEKVYPGKYKKEIVNAYSFSGYLNYKLKKIKKSIEYFNKVLKLDSTGNAAFVELYEINIIINQEINQTFVKNYIDNFQDKKEKFIEYEMLKIIKDISQNRKVALKAWQEKYKETSLNWSFIELEEWLRTLKDKNIRKQINEALKVFKRHKELQKSKL